MVVKTDILGEENKYCLRITDKLQEGGKIIRFESEKDRDAMYEVIMGLDGESELYRRGYQLIGACDIGNYLARCGEAGKILEG